MKKLFIIFLLAGIYISASFSQSIWQLNNSPITESFISVSFSSFEKGGIVSEEGSLLLTSDGGSNWQDYSFPEYHFSCLHFSDDDHGCIVGWQESPVDSSLILLTSDGGFSWSVIDHPCVNRFYDVFFINNNIGWAVGSKDAWNLNCCFYTSDGGLTWDYQPSISVVEGQLFGVHFRDEDLGSACGADGSFFITNNGGTTSWAMGIAMPLVNLNDIFNFNLLNGCIVGDQGTILYTINNWYQFIDQVSGTNEDFKGVSGNPPTNELWAVGNNGTILYSPNYLLGWASQPSGTSENLNDVCMLSGSEGWAVGANGTILHFTNEVGITELLALDKTTLIPNPATDKIQIQFPQLLNFISLTITDLYGKIVLFRWEDKPCKTYELDVSKLNTGVYLLKLETEFGTTIKQAVIKK
ncbi:MAG: T9SS type A sorting domain-containing protein [Bacteroidales bacterium]|nr:T9SS type A sorting domain-containing protein [Bacteroidales bacterium]MCF8402956.1 T9SS type A sorting domain-containing protein [Bacteroidales bacterium]